MTNDYKNYSNLSQFTDSEVLLAKSLAESSPRTFDEIKFFNRFLALSAKYCYNVRVTPVSRSKAEDDVEAIRESLGKSGKLENDDCWFIRFSSLFEENEDAYSLLIDALLKFDPEKGKYTSYLRYRLNMIRDDRLPDTEASAKKLILDEFLPMYKYEIPDLKSLKGKPHMLDLCYSFAEFHGITRDTVDVLMRREDILSLDFSISTEDDELSFGDTLENGFDITSSLDQEAVRTRICESLDIVLNEMTNGKRGISEATLELYKTWLSGIVIYSFYKTIPYEKMAESFSRYSFFTHFDELYNEITKVMDVDGSERRGKNGIRDSRIAEIAGVDISKENRSNMLKKLVDRIKANEELRSLI